jgi:hypothetical protein
MSQERSAARLVLEEHNMAIAIREIETETERELVREALDSGHLTVEEPHTCHHRLMYGRCPSGHVAALYPAQRDGVPITALVMHCPHCNANFPASPEDVVLE